MVQLPLAGTVSGDVSVKPSPPLADAKVAPAQVETGVPESVSPCVVPTIPSIGSLVKELIVRGVVAAFVRVIVKVSVCPVESSPLAKASATDSGERSVMVREALDASAMPMSFEKFAVWKVWVTVFEYWPPVRNPSILTENVQEPLVAPTRAGKVPEALSPVSPGAGAKVGAAPPLLQLPVADAGLETQKAGFPESCGKTLESVKFGIATLFVLVIVKVSVWNAPPTTRVLELLTECTVTAGRAMDWTLTDWLTAPLLASPPLAVTAPSAMV